MVHPAGLEGSDVRLEPGGLVAGAEGHSLQLDYRQLEPGMHKLPERYRLRHQHTSVDMQLVGVHRPGAGEGEEVQAVRIEVAK